MVANIIKPLGRKLKGKDQEVINMYYDQGCTMLYISQHFNCSTDVLRKFFKNNGLNTRNLEESKKLMRKRKLKSPFNFGDYPFKHKNLIGEDEKVRNLYENEEYSVLELSKMYDVNIYTIRTWLFRNGLNTRSPSESRSISRNNEKIRKSLQYDFDSEFIEKIKTQYLEGHGAKHIAKETGYDFCVIQRVLKENGVKTRNQKESHTEIKQEKFANTVFERFGGWKGRTQIQVDKHMEKYGVASSMQRSDVFYKQQHSARRFKKAIVEGVEITYQGYELRAVYALLSEGYNIDDIIIGRSTVPSFRYFYDGKNRVYYPDIFIAKDNRIIDAKSSYIYEKEIEKNLAKKDAVIKAGYKFDFYIMDNKYVDVA